jgi:hypothetical protein
MPSKPWPTYIAGHMTLSTLPWLRSNGTRGAFAGALRARISLRKRRTPAFQSEVRGDQKVGPSIFLRQHETAHRVSISRFWRLGMQGRPIGLVQPTQRDFVLDADHPRHSPASAQTEATAASGSGDSVGARIERHVQPLSASDGREMNPPPLVALGSPSGADATAVPCCRPPFLHRCE